LIKKNEDENSKEMRFLIRTLRENPQDLHKLIFHELQKRRIQQRNKIIYTLNSKYLDMQQLISVNIKYWKNKIAEISILDEKLKSVILRCHNEHSEEVKNPVISTDLLGVRERNLRFQKINTTVIMIKKRILNLESARYVCIYVYIYVSMCVCINIYIYACIHIYVCMYIYIHTSIYAYTIHIYIYTCTQIWTYMHNMHTHTHTYMYLYIY
jgi:hypothetical protein